VVTVSLHDDFYVLSLHDALPILKLFTQSFNKLHPMKEGASQETNVLLDKDSVFNYVPHPVTPFKDSIFKTVNTIHVNDGATLIRSEEHTSELQSRENLVCRLLLE